MGMCRGCGEVFSAIEMKDGYCKSCAPKYGIKFDNKEKIKYGGDSVSKESIIVLINKKTNDIKTVTIEFSFTTFFFGCFVPLLRGDYMNFLWILLVQIILIILDNIPYIGLFLHIAVMSYIALNYNLYYLKRLLSTGYEPYNEKSQQLLEKLGINVDTTSTAANIENIHKKSIKSLSDELEKLFSLYEKGAITKEEYEKLKSKLL